MIDKDYIVELKVFDDNKEVKVKLVEYVEQFGIKVKKNKFFDNIVVDIEEVFQKFVSEFMLEIDGLFIKDLIDVVDVVEGLKYDDEEVNLEVVFLIDFLIKFDIKIEVVEMDKIFENIDVLIEDIFFVEEKFEQVVVEIIEFEKLFVFIFLENFSLNF